MDAQVYKSDLMKEITTTIQCIGEGVPNKSWMIFNKFQMNFILISSKLIHIFSSSHLTSVAFPSNFVTHSEIWVSYSTMSQYISISNIHYGQYYWSHKPVLFISSLSWLLDFLVSGSPYCILPRKFSLQLLDLSKDS